VERSQAGHQQKSADNQQCEIDGQQKPLSMDGIDDGAKGNSVTDSFWVPAPLAAN
jgi:hypothetical protein